MMSLKLTHLEPSGEMAHRVSVGEGFKIFKTIVGMSVFFQHERVMSWFSDK